MRVPQPDRSLARDERARSAATLRARREGGGRKAGQLAEATAG
jgi:hypothetical protein